MKEWSSEINQGISKFQQLIEKYQPKLLFSFGAFAFEFGQRAVNKGVERSYGYWGARRLGLEFRKRIAKFDISKTNLIPLLHVSIARGRFIQSHEYFCDKSGANYFDFVGEMIASKIISNHENLDVWIE